MSKGGPTDFVFITPEQAAELTTPRKSVEHWRRVASRNGRCSVCGQPWWKFAQTGLCFTCTTGESDASDDYELVAQ